MSTITTVTTVETLVGLNLEQDPFMFPPEAFPWPSPTTEAFRLPSPQRDLFIPEPESVPTSISRRDKYIPASRKISRLSLEQCLTPESVPTSSPRRDQYIPAPKTISRLSTEQCLTPESLPRLSPEKCVFISLFEGLHSIATPFGGQGLALTQFSDSKGNKLFLISGIHKTEEGKLFLNLSIAKTMEMYVTKNLDIGLLTDSVSFEASEEKVFRKNGNSQNSEPCTDKELLKFIRKYQLLGLLEGIAKDRTKKKKVTSIARKKL